MNSQNEQLSPTKRALLELRKLRAQLAALERARTEPIAVIGIGCRFPGEANDPDSFWHNLKNGINAIGEIPPERWNVDAYYDPDPNAPGKMYTRRGGFLKGVEEFDAAFFGITPREAKGMDPQQRLLLEVSWEALERAGVRPDRLVGSQTGVFVGVMLNDYAQRYLHQPDPTAVDAYYATGTDISFASGRVSYVLGLQGPSMTLNTVCSSSLVTVHLACQSLRSGESDLALAGGVNVITSPEMFISLSRMGALAPDGCSKTFAAAADGYGRSEGCGIVVLKRLSDAQADGDPILALIRGSAVNHDGPSGALTVPNGPAQQALIRRALQNAGVEPHRVSYVEAHGSGTALGDPIEVKALNAVMGNGRRADQPLMIGSVKASIGHLESAAGVAGLIKVILALQHETVPPQLHLDEVNPALSLDNIPVVIPAMQTPWQANGNPRCAGVSSFGLSGINAHVVVEEAPTPTAPATSAAADRPFHLLTLSAKNEAALQAQVARYERYLAAHPEVALADVCYTANTTRTPFGHRLSLVASSTADAEAKLGQIRQGEDVAGVWREQVDAERSLIAFLFPGQGGQYAQMGRELYDTHAGFRQTVEECAQLARPYLERPLLPVIYPADDEPSPLDEMIYAQPAVFTIEYALAKLWQSWGIQPDLLLGHSLGEYTAACLAGVFDLADAIKLVCARGRLMQKETEPGWMVVVFTGEAQVEEAIAPYQDDVGIAAINGPRNVTISGRAEAAAAVVAALEAQGVRTRRLNIPHASHSPLMAPILEPFRQVVATVDLFPQQIDVVSNVSGRLAGTELATVDYWVNHLRRPVRFTDGITSLQQEGAGIFIDMGPRPTLMGMGQRTAGTGVWLPSLRPKRGVRPFGAGEWQKMLESLGALYTLGVAVDWDGLEQDHQRQRLVLPTYPFQRQRYWLETRPSGHPATAQVQPQSAAPVPDWLYELSWQEQERTEAQSIVSANGRWLILADDTGVGQALAAQLQDAGHRCTLVWPGDGYRRDEDGVYLDPARPEQVRRLLDDIDEPLQGVIHLWGANPVQSPTLTQLQQAQALGCGSVLHLLQALDERQPDGRLPLWLVTRGTQPVADIDVEVTQAPLWGLGRVVALEQPERWGGLVDLPPQVDLTTDIDQLLPELLHPDGENQVAFRNSRRFVPRLVRAQSPAGDAPLTIEPDGTYLITGGLGKLGLEVAQWLVAQGARHLVLTSRSGLPDEGEAETSSLSAAQSERVRIVQEMRAQGAQIMAPRADVADQAQMSALWDQLAQSWPPLRGVVHAAGVVDSQPLSEMSAGALHTVFQAKVAGTWVLHQLTQAADSLDFLVLFSSGASVWGSQGLAHYAAANHFLDAIAHHRRALDLPALSINWGRWDTRGLVTDELARFFAQIGLEEMPKAQALDTLGYLLEIDAVQTAVAAVDWQRFKPIYEARGRQPLLAQIDAGETADQQPVEKTGHSIAAQLEAASASDQWDLLLGHVRDTVAGVIGLDSPQTLDLDQGFFAIGMDSIMTVELRNRLEVSLACSLLPTVAFEYPTVNELTTYLATDVLRLKPNGRVEQPPLPESDASPQANTNGHTRNDLDALSEEDLLALVSDELSVVGELVEED